MKKLVLPLRPESGCASRGATVRSRTHLPRQLLDRPIDVDPQIPTPQQRSRHTVQRAALPHRAPHPRQVKGGGVAASPKTAVQAPTPLQHLKPPRRHRRSSHRLDKGFPVAVRIQLRPPRSTHPQSVLLRPRLLQQQLAPLLCLHRRSLGARSTGGGSAAMRVHHGRACGHSCSGACTGAGARRNRGGPNNEVAALPGIQRPNHHKPVCVKVRADAIAVRPASRGIENGRGGWRDCALAHHRFSAVSSAAEWRTPMGHGRAGGG